MDNSPTNFDMRSRRANKQMNPNMNADENTLSQEQQMMENMYEFFERKRKHSHKRWYNQGWVWLIAAAFGIGVLLTGFLLLSNEVSEVSSSIDKQTEAIREQGRILEGIRGGLVQLGYVIKDAVTTIIQAIRQ